MRSRRARLTSSVARDPAPDLPIGVLDSRLAIGHSERVQWNQQSV